MLLGMSSAGFYGRMETEEEAAHLTEFPLDVCEIFLQTRSEYNAAFGQEVHTRLHGLPCLSVHPKGTQFEPDLFGQSPRQRQDGMETFAGVLDAGRALGSKWYVFHGPSGIQSPMRPERIPFLTERFQAMQAAAAQRGMEVLWENVSWCTIRTPQEVESAIRLLPDIHFVLDIKQAFRAGVDPFDMLAAMGNRVRHVHVLDWDESGTLCLPGEGVVDFPKLLKQLKKQGFDGGVMLEPYAAQTLDEEAVYRALTYLQHAMT